jgi:phosphate starvation-inducible PhoH-like protein
MEAIGGAQIKNDQGLTKDEFEFKSVDLYQVLCGVNDERIPEVSSKLGLQIIPRGKTFILQGESVRVQNAKNLLAKLEENYSARPDKFTFDVFDWNYFLKQEETHEWAPQDKIFTNYKGKTIFPKTYNQDAFTNSLKNNFISFAIGPAGTGKTFLSIAVACRMLQQGEIERLVLTRPAVEAGESLGFLPGDLVQKVNPYLRPIYDALGECIGHEKTQELISSNKIEIAPIAFMRGRTLSHSFILLDEAQNCTKSQLKMILTRFGKNSKMSIVGDSTQVDLPERKSGLETAARILENTKGIGVIRFGKEDITRHPIVETIIQKWEKFDDESH